MTIRISVFLGLFFINFVYAQQSIKLMHYNLLNFGNPCENISVLDKYSWLGEILEEARPDVLTVNELNPNPIFSNGILSQSFAYTNAFSGASITNKANSNIVNQLFFNKDKLSLIPLPSSQAIISYGLRDINAYKLYVRGSGATGGDSLFFYCVVGHLKASTGTSNENSRNVAANLIMDWISQYANGEPVVVMGDFNIYGPSEAAYQTLTNNSNASLNLNDVVPTVGWGGRGGANFYTQSTRSSSQDCGAGGGLDDKFDMILMSDELLDINRELHYVPDSYTAFGNDGDSYNETLACVGNNEVPFGVCTSLILMSDHLPVIIELEASSVVSRKKEIGIAGLEAKIMPQPVGEYLGLNLVSLGSKTFDSFQVNLTNVLGQVILSDQIKTGLHRWNVSFLDPGLYVLKIQDERGKFITEKVWIK